MVSGSVVALVTPMHPSGSIDWESLQRLIDWHVAEGTAGIVSVGTTGESSTIGVDEHLEVVRRTALGVAGRIPVIAGTGANATREAIELTEAAKRLGADACLLVTPYYNKPTQEGLYRHYRAIAEAEDIPQILYHVPSRTACDLLPETVYRLAAVPGIVGLKEATGDLGRARELIAHLPSAFSLFSGDDATAAEFMLAGGHGTISVTANVVPGRFAAMCRAALVGDAALARSLDAEIAELHRLLFLESNPIPAKWALAEMGMMEHGIRLPLTPLSATHQPRLRRALADLGLLAPCEA
jgi:4-hydroxy-tetrahydrodipicolinate synthase